MRQAPFAALAAAALLASAGTASATLLPPETWDLSAAPTQGTTPTPGNTGVAELDFVTATLTLKVTAGTYSSTFSSPLTLTGLSAGDFVHFQQNVGIGACTGSETGNNCKQLDSVGPNEYVRLELPSANWRPLTLVVGDVQSNASKRVFDDISIWGANSAVTTLSAATATLLANGDIAALQIASQKQNGDWTIDLSGTTSSNFQYIYIASNSDDDDGFRIVSFTGQDPIPTVDRTAVPEPASLALFGVGLVGLAAARRRRTAA